MNPRMRIYADTSVFGGAFDPEFETASVAFFDRVRAGDFELAVSALVTDELVAAPAQVKALLAELEPIFVRLVVGPETIDLRHAYMEAGVVGPRWAADALHVATATVHGCRAIVSWNFRHIVSFRRIPMYNGVNQLRGYGTIAIHSPQEVAFDEVDEKGV